MNNLYQIIEKLCADKGENITQMCKAAGVPRGNITDLKMGRQSGLSGNNMRKIAEHFGVTVDYLMTGENKKPAPIIESGELNRKKVFAEMLSCLPERDRIIIEHNILMFWRLAKEEGTLKPSETSVDLDWIIGNLSARRDHLLGANA